MKGTARKSKRLLLALVLATGFLFATSGTVYATEGADNNEKSWDGARVVSATETAECTPITSDMENIGGEVPSWYVVKGDVPSIVGWSYGAWSTSSSPTAPSSR